jgi:pilus assembly protein Flp/PilA
VGVSHLDAPGGTAMTLMNTVRSFVRRDEGQDLLEYALLVALIALFCVAAIKVAGTNVSTIFTNIANALVGA